MQLWWWSVEEEFNVNVQEDWTDVRENKEPVGDIHI